jgi:inner membrane protein
MLFWTHFVVTLFGILLIFNSVENSFIFFIVALFSSFIPDIDSEHSKVGKFGISKVLSSFSKHRGIFHSLFFVFLVGFILWIYFPIISFAFIFGYSIHLFVDSFTKRGVRLFYPFKFKIRGFIRSGGFFENLIFVVFLILDLGLILVWLF